jgi:hypothetical protein
MEHLSLEILSGLVEERPSPDQAAHLASCDSCRSELTALRAQTEALRSLPDLRPPLGDWDELQARLVSEGLVKRPGGWSAVLAETPGWMRAVAAVLLFLGGTATGIGVARSSVVPFGDGLAGLGSADTPEEAAEVVQLAETRYVEALYHYRQLIEATGGADQFADPTSRYAGLDYVTQSLEAALREAPADPFFNGMLATARAEQQAVLRHISTTSSNGW